MDCQKSFKLLKNGVFLGAFLLLLGGGMGTCDYHFGIGKMVRDITRGKGLPRHCPECGGKLENGEEEKNGL